ncbi:MAG: acyltransferase [Bacteroidales bacterium]|nr:acyltransferase [Bacteroidales bacterium]
MKRILFYIYSYSAIMARLFPSSCFYMKLIMKAHRSAGVRFIGIPEYIDHDSYLDPSGGLTISQGVVISTKVIILTHDWSFLKKMKLKGKTYDESSYAMAFNSVEIGEESFVGAGSVILPGTKIGKYCIVGAGAVVKGVFEDYSVIVGSPARRIKDVRE